MTTTTEKTKDGIGYNNQFPAYINVYEALMFAQMEFPTIEKNKRGQHGNRTFMYADLTDVINQVRPILFKHGLMLTLPTRHEGNFMFIECQLHHPSTGTSIICPYPAHEFAEARAMGGGVTYARRYVTGTVLNLVLDEDTDGEGVRTMTKPRVTDTATYYMGGFERTTTMKAAEDLWQAFKGEKPNEADYNAVKEVYGRVWTAHKMREKRGQVRDERPSHNEERSLPSTDPDKVLREIEDAFNGCATEADVEAVISKYESIVSAFIAESDREAYLDAKEATIDRIREAQST